MSSPYIQNGKASPIISIVFFKSDFSNIKNNDVKCPYLLRPKEEHFKVVFDRK